MLNAILLIAATRFFQIAANTYFVHLSTFTLDQDSKGTHIPVLTLPPAIDTRAQYAIIQPDKVQTPIKPQLDKRLHFLFSERSHAASTDHPSSHNCTFKISYRTGGNNQIEPKKEAHQQFRYSAARNRAHRPVHPPRYPRLL